MRERFRASDYRFLAICLALFAATVWFSVHNFYLAFPEAAIDFRVNREEAGAIGERFLAGQGYRFQSYRKASRFSYDDEAKTFLERTVGLEGANRIMGTRVRLWRWSYRWFVPQQKEEFRVDVTPAGGVAGFEHQIAESAARPSIAPAQARALAEGFLRDRLRRNADALDFVEGSTVARPARTDHVFVWKERDFDVGDATNRLEVVVAGDEVAGYREYLKVPERWTRDYERLRSGNEMAQSIDTASVLALVVGLVVTIGLRIRRRDVRWRRAAMVGLVGAALSLLSQWNQFPVSEFNYPTTDSYGAFAARQALQSVLGALATAGLLFALAAGAECLYREAFPGQISLGHLFRPRGLRTKTFFLGTVLGICLTGVFFAYQIAFYRVAYHFGAWSPADVPYDDLLNTRFPWLFVLFGGYLPAVSEEFLFRMFGVPFLRKLVRSLPVALVLAGFLWGFGHAGYPQQPFFIRGLEVGVGGVALGLIMMRWGILPALVWHYSVDALYSAMLLLRSHRVYFQLSGAASAGIMLLPAAVALAAYFRYGGFEPETGLTNASEPAPQPEPPPARVDAGQEEAPPFSRLTPRLRLAALAVLGVGMLALLLPVDRFGESPKYKLGAGEARVAADAFLRTRGLDPGAFRIVAYPAAHWGGDDSLAGKYFLERSALSFASSLFERNRPVRHWAVRYFKPLDREEALVSVHPETGKVMGFDHTLPEDRAGADLSPEAARGVAEAFAAAGGWDLGRMALKESTSEKKKARRDHTLVWEAQEGDRRNVAEARYRVEIRVAGDAAASVRSYWKIPEAFTRARSRQNALSLLLALARIALGCAGIVAALWLLIRGARDGALRYGAALRLAGAATAFAALGALLRLPQIYKDYSTAIPLV